MKRATAFVIIILLTLSALLISFDVITNKYIISGTYFAFAVLIGIIHFLSKKKIS